MNLKSNASFVFICNDLSYFIAHRLHVMQNLQNRGLDVHVIADAGTLRKNIWPSNFHAISLVRRSLSIKNDIKAFIDIWRIIAYHQAEIVHAITIKPIIFIGIMMILRQIFGKNTIPCVFTFPGLGEVFRVVRDEPLWIAIKRKLRRSMVLRLYQNLAKLPNICMTFENAQDCAFAIRKFNIPAHKAYVISGAGINLHDFLLLELKPISEPIKILFAARLLRTKGIFDFIDAVKLARKNGTQFQAIVAGIPDEGNSETISQAEIDAIARTGIIEYLGFVADMPALLKSVDVVVLPTFYREGLPRVLIEAAAAGCALLAYNAPGIQDILHNRINGKIIETGNVKKLADAITKLANSPEKLHKMQAASIKIIQKGNFSEEDVQAQFLNVYETARLLTH